MAFLLVVALMAACTSAPPDPTTDDVPTKGDVLILAEEDFRSVLEAQKLAFENIYAEARIRLRYLPQAELMQAMMNDSVRAVFTTCLPGAEQQAYFRTRNLSVDEVPVLTDGIAVVSAPGDESTAIARDSLREWLAGHGRSAVLFDGVGTGVVRSVVDSLFGGDAALVRGASAVAGADSLVQRVAAVNGIVGLLSFARISDLDDPRCRALRAGVDLRSISSENGKAVLPSQSTLADGSYPLRRTLYALVTEGKAGLGTGFVSFVAGHKGQRIILKSGLAPQRVPAREVMLVN